MVQKRQKMKVFLDDFRYPEHCLAYMPSRIGSAALLYGGDWVIARNYDEFVDVVSKHHNTITHISLDHDLADEHYDPHMTDTDKYNQLYEGFKEKTGYDCAVWLKDFYKESQLPIIFIHSMNPVGVQNISKVLNS